jgi:hypothetical protein
MSALIGLYQPAVNRLLPYRALHTDIFVHEQYYTFNDPTVEALIAGAGTDWTEGTDALAEPVSVHKYDGNDPLQLNESASVTNSSDVYIESAVANVDSALPCTFRVIVKAASTQWVRIFDPNDADTDVWIEAQSTDTAAVLGDVGSDVIEARVTYPPPDLVAGSIGSGGGAEGQHNGYSICEFELPAAASRTIRIQLVDSNGGTVLNGVGNVVYLAEAQVLNGKVAKWTCRRTGRTFSQETPANQPYARPMGVRACNGRRVLRFSGSQELVSDDAASTWEFLHDGSGATIEFAWLPTTGGSGNETILGTRTDGGDTGFLFLYDATNAHGVVVLEDTVAASIVLEVTANGTLPNSTLYCTSLRFQDNGTADFVGTVGGETLSVANVDYSSASGDPEQTLTIGTGFDGYIADIAIYEARLTDDEDERAIEEFEAQNATSGSIPGNILWTRYDDGVTESGGAVTALQDLSPEQQDIDVVSTDPGYVAESTAFRGTPCVLHESTGQYFECPAVGAALTGQVARCVIATSLMSELNTSGNASWLWQLWGAGGGSFEGVDQAASGWRFLRRDNGGATDNFAGASADVRPHTHSYVTTDGVDILTWIDGVADLDTTSNRSLTTDNFFWSIPGSTEGDFAGVEMAVYDAAPTTYQRKLVERAQRRRMLGMMSLKMGFSLGEVGPAASAEDLLSVAQSLGAVLLFDVYDAANYVLSGADFVSVKNLISGVDHNVAGTAPTYSATDFNGGPGVIFGGAGWFVGSEAAVVDAMTDANPHTLVVARRFDATNRHLFGAGNSASATGYRLYGVLTADSFTQTRVDGGSAATIQATNDDDGAEHIDTWLRVGGGSPTIQLIRDNATTILGPQTQTTPTLTPNNYAWGTSPDDTPTSFPMLGGGSLVILFPSALDASQRSTLFDAIANHHAALGGLL